MGREVTLQRPEAVAGQRQRVEIDLQIELRQLTRVRRSAEAFQQLLGDEGGPPAAVDQEELLLHADPPHVGLDHAALDHPLQGVQVPEHGARKRARRFRFALGLGVLTHEAVLSSRISAPGRRGRSMLDRNGRKLARARV